MNSKRNKNKQKRLRCLRDKCYGGNRGKKTEGTIRFYLGNIGTLPSQRSMLGQLKLDRWRDLVLDGDVHLISEINKDLGCASEQDQLDELVKGWWRGPMCRVEYLHESDYYYREVHQQGGVGVIVQGKATSFIIEQGGDMRKLGRWRWITIKGKMQRKTCIIGCYCPGITWVANRNQAVALQKRKYADLDHIDPVTLWMEDLKRLIQSKIEEQCEVIIGGDFNDNLRAADSIVVHMFSSLRLREVLIEKYEDVVVPPTYERGRDTIDGIFMTQGLNIRKGGYTSFDISPSDHRWLWFDIEEALIYGTNVIEPLSAISRRVSSKIPSVQEKFNKLVNQFMTQHKMPQKVRMLKGKCKEDMERGDELSKNSSRQIDVIYDNITRAIQYADKRCKKVRVGAIPFSPTLRNIQGAIRILTLLNRRKKEIGKKYRPRMRRIRRMIKRYQYTGPTIFESENAVTKERRIMLYKYKEIKRTLVVNPNTYMGQIAVERSQKDGRGIEHHYNQLMVQDGIKRQFQRIKRAERRPLKTGVVMVEKDTDQGRILITDREEIEYEIGRANKKRLLQSYNTPFRQEPLQTIVGEQMDFTKWEKILRGEIELPEEGIEEGTKLWYNLISSNKLESFKLDWTPVEYFESWKKMKEEKASAPGIHNGHLKCIDPYSSAAQVISDMALLPLQTGYTPLCWRIGIDSMIPKKANDLRPEKLRLILLMDARFNHNNKLIGKKILEFGEKHGLVAEEQYGSRKNRSSAQHALNKRLILDKLRQYKIPAVYCANDARSCYDRILLMVAYMTLRMFGLKKEAARCSINTLCVMRHYIRTVFGISEQYYGGEKWISEEGQFPHGNGQGNGNGPSLWCGISSTLLHIMKKKGYGIHFISPISGQKLEIGPVGYVDDIDYIETSCETTIEATDTLFAIAQEGLTLWEQLLSTTGGALEIDKGKTDFVVVSFEQKRNGLIGMNKKLYHQTLRARDYEGRTCELEQLTVDKARKTLGVYQSPTGDENQEFLFLHNKICEWGGNVWKSRLSKLDSRKAVITTIGRTIAYPLSATALSEEQSGKLTSTFLKFALPKSGVAKTTARDIVFAPVSIMGLAYPDIWTQQLIAHVDILLDHGGADTLTGNLIRMYLEGLYIEAGIGGDCFTWDIEGMPWITDSWATRTIKALRKGRITLQHNIRSPLVWRKDDFFIMEGIIEKKIYSSIELRMINEVRLYLKVLFFSDLCNADSTRVAFDQAGDTQYTSTCSGYAFQWPNSVKPTKKMISLWRDSIQRCYGITNLECPERLRLGNWNNRIRGIWQWWVSRDKMELFFINNDSVRKYVRNQRVRSTRRYTYMFEANIMREAMPEECKPVSVTEREVSVLITAMGDIDGEEQREEALDWVNRKLSCSDDSLIKVVEQIGTRKAEFVCDGSFFNSCSSSAFISVHDESLYGGNIVPGSSMCHSAYRGELAGILSILCFVNKVTEQYNITSGKVMIGCDCQGVLNAVKNVFWVSSRWSNFDLLKRIQYEIRNAKVEYEYYKVKAHQDDIKKYDELDRWERANIKADFLAKQLIQQLGIEGYQELSIPITEKTGWMLKLNNSLVTKNIRERIRTHVWAFRGKQYWVRRLRLQEAQVQYIWWDILESLGNTLPEYKRVKYVKVMAGIAPVGKVLNQRDATQMVGCPLCGQEEDTVHIWRCNYVDIKEAIETGMAEIVIYLDKGPPLFKRYILGVFEMLVQGKDLGNDIVADLCDCGLRGRMNFPHHCFVWGFYHVRWKKILEEFFTDTRRSPKKWIVMMTCKFWELWEQLWEIRNNIKFNPAGSISEREEMDLQIEEIYKVIPPLRMMNITARSLFKGTIEEKKQYSQRKKKKWIRDAGILLEQFQEEQKRSKSVLGFRQYFTVKRHKVDTTSDLAKDTG
mmetsp:Transcript_8494/g.16012  ORF Transcript_8494/g.16012 Transcript_8494/m.16012 type:complete len:1891 (+) Transcript_8494:4302-9974(+)